MYSNDSELLAGMLAGDEAAFRSFFTAYFPRLYRFALPRLNRDVEATKEVVQSTLTKAVRNPASYRGEAALFSWLCQICRRQIVDYLRENRRHSANVVLFDGSTELRAALDAMEAPATSDPMEGYGSAQTRQLVQSVLDRLPGRYGDVLEWKYIEGRSVEEIGERLGIGQIGAQSMLARARTAFREMWKVTEASTARRSLATCAPLAGPEASPAW
jgi:RNA polymerase sigma-70 factor (ECF subfamily)